MVGLGSTGFAVLDTLVELGVEVTAIASDADDDVVNISRVLGATVHVSSASTKREEVAQKPWDFAVVSPGLPADDPVVSTLRARGVPVLSDLDFAWRVRDKNTDYPTWVVVAGDTHGELVSDLAARILRADDLVVGVAGYGGPPVLDFLRDPAPYQVLIIRASLSSLRWWGSHEETGREPTITVMVDEHAPDWAGVLYEGTSMACVYRKGLGPTEGFVESADVVEGARAIGVGLDSPGMSDLGLVEGIVCDRAFLEDRRNQALEISTVEELEEAGWDVPAAMPAILAAVAIARAHDVSPALIAGVLSLP